MASTHPGDKRHANSETHIEAADVLFIMLLERERELELLTGLVDDVSRSGGKVVLIRGEASIGKSALVAELSEARISRQHAVD